MTTKTDDEIQREKDAVAKMIGAKSAMETALERISRLQRTLDGMAGALDDAAKRVGPDLYIKTYFWPGRNGSEMVTVPLQEQLKRVAQMAREVL